MDIGHLHIFAKDVAASKDFYVENFGFSVLIDNEGFDPVLRDKSGIDVVISPITEEQSKGNTMHFGLRESSADAVKAKCEELSAKMDLCMPLTEEGFLTIFGVMDPDGNLVEVYHAAV